MKENNVEGPNFGGEDLNDSRTMVFMAAVSNEHVHSKIRFLDTGCLNHMIGQRVWLENFNELKNSKVTLVDSS